MDTVVKMQDLGCKAGNRFILKNIDWEVQKGQHWVVFGMNGSGKTTLLSIAAGYMGYTHGELEVLGQTYNDENVLDIRRRIGWVSASFLINASPANRCWTLFWPAKRPLWAWMTPSPMRMCAAPKRF